MRTRKWLLAAVVGLTAWAFAPGPAAGAAPARYLNLQQCMYYWGPAADHFTTVTPSSDGRFKAGTNVSDTKDTAPACGAGDGNFAPVPILSGVTALDLRSGRYLNLQQCTYFSPSAFDYFTTVGGSQDNRFKAGTNVSDTQDPPNDAVCGSGDGNYVLVPSESYTRSLDLTSGKFLNVHQCLFYSAEHTDHDTKYLGGGGSYSAGSNVSGTADTAPVCGPGAAGYDPIPLLSGVRALPLS
ncbi:hypothetical protein [Streptomyces fuscichromogenes]|uniref:GON domain-containing protein n=1 Tax=Streptomyces fuscichromogenes TaxID=1324013 RepID=A0A918CUJ9_9ACTN|nr:hypothetical protein [Streptomyces fuscichromogenes]GGN28841.1 hypothetical protein GCM10011578_065090 [Streptomyces fuscichromogenes]